MYGRLPSSSTKVLVNSVVNISLTLFTSPCIFNRHFPPSFCPLLLFSFFPCVWVQRARDQCQMSHSIISHPSPHTPLSLLPSPFPSRLFFHFSFSLLACVWVWSPDSKASWLTSSRLSLWNSRCWSLSHACWCAFPHGLYLSILPILIFYWSRTQKNTPFSTHWLLYSLAGRWLT